MILKFIKLDVVNNTIEANWFDNVLDENGNVVAHESVRCINYSKAQKDDFLAAVPDGAGFVNTMGW